MIRALLATVALAFAAGTSGLASTSGASRSCPVTVPARTVPPGAGFTAVAFNYGNAKLRAHL